MSIDREKLNKILQVNYAKGVTSQTDEREGEGGSGLRKNLRKKKKRKLQHDPFEEDDPITPPSQTGGASY